MSMSEPRAGSEEVWLLWRGVRLRIGRVRGIFVFDSARVCPGGGRLCTAVKSGPGPGEGAEYGSWGGGSLEGRWGEERGPLGTRLGWGSQAWGGGGTTGSRAGVKRGGGVWSRGRGRVGKEDVAVKSPFPA